MRIAVMLKAAGCACLVIALVACTATGGASPSASGSQQGGSGVTVFGTIDAGVGAVK